MAIPGIPWNDLYVKSFTCSMDIQLDWYWIMQYCGSLDQMKFAKLIRVIGTSIPSSREESDKVLLGAITFLSDGYRDLILLSLLVLEVLLRLPPPPSLAPGCSANTSEILWNRKTSHRFSSFACRRAAPNFEACSSMASNNRLAFLNDPNLSPIAFQMQTFPRIPSSQKSD